MATPEGSQSLDTGDPPLGLLAVVGPRALTEPSSALGVARPVVERSRTAYHVSHRVRARPPLVGAAVARAILAKRRGRADLVVTDGELQSGAAGVAVPLGVDGREASVAVMAFDRLGPGAVEQAFRTAAERIARGLR